MKITEMSAENRPRERLEKEGAGVLSTAELLAIILKSGTKKENVLEISHKLLSKYGLEKLSSCSLPELTQEYGIGKAKACQLVALFELYRRVHTPNGNKIPITKAKDIVQLYQAKLQSLQKEHFIAVYLDTKHHLICDQVISIGVLNASLVHPREVFHGAIKNLAHSLIVLHNHPSGDPSPSAEDREITKRLHKTGEVMGIHFIDHVIIGKNGWWSWKEEG